MSATTTPTESATAPGVTMLVDGEHRLAGFRCTACGTHTFPTQSGCPRCGSPMDRIELPSSGTLWSFTVQRLPPKPPYAGPADRDAFVPFGVGYVDLGVVKVETVLSGRDVEGWAIGQPVRLVLGEADADGEIRHYTFAPAEEARP